jgi:hypothetical protein
MRKCVKCGQDKALDAFECTNSDRGWYRRECKVCVRNRVRRCAEDSKSKIQEYRRAYHSKHREKIIVKVNDWVQKNPDRRRKNALAYYYRLQHAAIEAYGGYRCGWCGIDEPLVLCIDHVANNGRAHRQEIGSLGGHRFYKWLRDSAYPPGFQVLCMNCNHGKYRNGGVLPPTLKGRCNDYPERE